MIEQFGQGNHCGQTDGIICDAGTCDMIGANLKYMACFRTEYAVSMGGYQYGRFSGASGYNSAGVSKFIDGRFFKSIFPKAINHQSNTVAFPESGRWDFPEQDGISQKSFSSRAKALDLAWNIIQ